MASNLVSKEHLRSGVTDFDQQHDGLAEESVRRREVTERVRRLPIQVWGLLSGLGRSGDDARLIKASTFTVAANPGGG